jgi:hypothetical protein
MKKTIRSIEIGLLGIVSLSAMFSGAVMVIYPGGKLMELPLSMLKGSPFRNFFWPGLILFCIIGLGHAVALTLVLRRHRLAGPAAAMMGLGLLIWIFIQVSMIGGGHWLQYLYFALGTAEVSLAVLLLKE